MCVCVCVVAVHFHISLSYQSKLNASLRELEMKQAEVTKVQDRERTLNEALQETVASNPFEEFLTKVFKKMVKRDKKKDQDGGRGGRK